MRRLLLCMLLFAGATPLSAAEPFELRDGDRVVLIGSTLIEREQRHGYWETALTARWPERNVIFRNLGWSGDTVWAEARAGFGTPEQGFKQLIDGVKGLKPTVLIIGYGTNESFAGPAGLSRFRAGLERLLDALAPTKARVVLLSPLAMENLGPPLPDSTAQNENLALYTKAIAEIARKRGHRFADLFTPTLQGNPEQPLTDNGLHPTADGYRRLTGILEQALGLKPMPLHAEKLRQAIIEKNRLYFHRWRPQNETYLFGFRKHEQGQNAREVPLFDPLVEKMEKEIVNLLISVKPR